MAIPGLADPAPTDALRVRVVHGPELLPAELAQSPGAVVWPPTRRGLPCGAGGAGGVLDRATGTVWLIGSGPHRPQPRLRLLRTLRALAAQRGLRLTFGERTGAVLRDLHRENPGLQARVAEIQRRAGGNLGVANASTTSLATAAAISAAIPAATSAAIGEMAAVGLEHDRLAWDRLASIALGRSLPAYRELCPGEPPCGEEGETVWSDARIEQLAAGAARVGLGLPTERHHAIAEAAFVPHLQTLGTGFARTFGDAAGEVLALLRRANPGLSQRVQALQETSGLATDEATRRALLSFIERPSVPDPVRWQQLVNTARGHLSPGWQNLGLPVQWCDARVRDFADGAVFAGLDPGLQRACRQRVRESEQDRVVAMLTAAHAASADKAPPAAE